LLHFLNDKEKIEHIYTNIMFVTFLF